VSSGLGFFTFKPSKSLEPGHSKEKPGFNSRLKTGKLSLDRGGNFIFRNRPQHSLDQLDDFSRRSRFA
jgi:hypothetical protein